MLLAAELVETQRGVRGGYRLMKILAHISLMDIVEAMEGPIAVTDCIEGARQPCAARNCCCMRNHWNHVNLAIRRALMDVTLEDLTNPAALIPLPDTSPLTKDEPATCTAAIRIITDKKETPNGRDPTNY